MGNLSAINHPLSLKEIAYEALRDNIMAGKLEPGIIYSEMAIAKDLGISRTPVREALLELSSQGIVKFLPRKGLMIRQYYSEDVIEIFELRRAIEIFAVKKISKNKSRMDFTEAKKAIDQQKMALARKDISSFLLADRFFHLSLAKMTNNKRIISNLENIRDIIHLMGLKALEKNSHAKEIIEEHEDLLYKLMNETTAQAKKAMEYHLIRSEKAVLKAYQ